MVADVGQRLRLVRVARNLSQRELAKRTGVTNSTISLIESGDMNPSIGTLKRVLDGIPVTLGDFFSFETEGQEKYFYPAADLTEIGQSGVSLRQVGGNLFGRALQVLHERYEPAADTGVAYAHDGEEAGVIIHGQVEVTVEDQTRILGPGDAYYFDSRKPHRFRCIGEEPCELISACTPPTF
ncbi:cupin domain-containing protein [Gluconobacter frateurii]|uniref:Aldehyde dehydrogenase n=1 Tax=Gluconobacter frateurii NRIC 0228 TaxID=1307946 RepID=A0ABQ0Q851_9PROT|nr:cupin domain-containing protein [Gluconobacter frateurii]OAG73270.1 aldehyde dehydrogenase-like protein [Gluconobacter japonicus]UMM07121.1 cupin domain-containing protein [Gluconobacter frateurii]GBR08491.1 aldehyde dehydrogenase [Gluconobacter frateurii NRIC 0228]GLP91071.1 aldehyde dehydrogenase [Gluconobacter frateurii]